jgi:hypothetical protein
MLEQMNSPADALVAQLAAYDDRLAGIEQQPDLEVPYLHRLQDCVARLRKE